MGNFSKLPNIINIKAVPSCSLARKTGQNRKPVTIKLRALEARTWIAQDIIERCIKLCYNRKQKGGKLIELPNCHNAIDGQLAQTGVVVDKYAALNVDTFQGSAMAMKPFVEP